MSDLISRQAALKPFCIAPDGTRIPEVDCDNFPVEFGVEFIKKHLLSLPSATCDDCIWHTCNYNKVDWDGEEGYISKRDTIRLLVEKYKFTTKEAREILAELPSAEPKTGEWIECGTNTDGTHNIKCDQCGAGFRTRGHANSHNTKERFKWCPTCGARMLGEDGEEE